MINIPALANPTQIPAAIITNPTTLPTIIPARAAVERDELLLVELVLDELDVLIPIPDEVLPVMPDSTQYFVDEQHGFRSPATQSVLDLNETF